MQVKIDPELCTACGLCPDEVPEVFRMGDDVAEVINSEVPPNLEAKVRAQAEDCPGSAIIIE
ncbi:MAG TPA: ferredoxin [Spirochaetia bacterium]|nr:ferredoxin [Spirochaetia bacterium]